MEERALAGWLDQLGEHWCLRRGVAPHLGQQAAVRLYVAVKNSLDILSTVEDPDNFDAIDLETVEN